MKKLMFSKMTQKLTIEETAEHAMRLGFYGIDLTCRDGGHVLPENVRVDLPRAVELFENYGLKVPMISTGITSGEEDYAEAVFETAGGLGIEFVKLGYWWLGDGFEPGRVMRRFDEAARGVEKIYRLAEKYDTCAVVHIHSGNCINAIPVLIERFLNGKNTSHIGAYLDFGHMVVEGGNSGWRINFDILTPFLKIIAVKNFIWLCEKKDGRAKWTWRTAPLADGIADWPEIVGLLKQIGYDGYASFHSEYLEDYSWKVLNTEECLNQTGEDIKFFDSI